MSPTSLVFIGFLICLIVLYFLVPKKYQWVTLLLANIIFYVSGGAKYIVYILLTSIITYCGAIKLENINQQNKEKLSHVDTPEEKRAIRAKTTKKKKLLTLLIILLILGTWATIKYGNFVIDNLNILFKNIHMDYTIGGLNVVLPLGMSFYTFISLGYMIDVYRSKYSAQRNFLKYFTFVSFFPHITQGPFSKYDVLSKTLYEEHSFNYDRLCEGAARMLWGFFKKIVIADTIGISVDKIFGDYQAYPGFNILCVVFLYAIQIYADFSGYMDIVCGFCKILDIELQENFNQPYFSKSIDEFWRRWHMTLCQWFRDYVFYSVSMSKAAQRIGKGARNVFGNKWGRLLPAYFALIFVWTCTGLWHGANWTYLIWGYLNFIVIMCSMHWAEYYRKAKDVLHIKDGNPVWEGFRILRTFTLVAFFRFFAVADSVGIAVGMIKRIFTNPNAAKVLANPSNIFPGLELIQIIIVCASALVLLVVDILVETGKWETVKKKAPVPVRALAYSLMLLLIFLLVPIFADVQTGDFMYAGF